MTASPWHPAISPCCHTEAACIRGNRMKAEHRRQGTGEGEFYRHWCKILARRRLWQPRRNGRRSGDGGAAKED